MEVDKRDLEAERLTDDTDRASSEADFAVREARRRQELQAAASMPAPDGTGDCISCEEPVEPQRLALGLGLCFCCADRREKLAQRQRAGR